MTEELPSCAGIYQICCQATGKIYIGSAVNLKKRWSEHRRSLRRGKHANSHLQSAWNKYGEAVFSFAVLEYTDVSNLLKAEQEWIDSTGCIDKDIGFNIALSASSPGGSNIGVWEGFIDPDGKDVCIVGLQNFLHPK